MKKLLSIVLTCILFLFIYMVYCTITYSSRQINPKAIEPIVVNPEAPERLSSAIRIATVSTGESIDTAAFLSFLTFLDKEYPLVDSFLTKTQIGEFSRIYHWKGNDPDLAPVLLIGHYDVVPVEEEARELWDISPYSGKISDGFIWGRGSLDDKLAVLGILEATEKLLEKSFLPGRDIYFAFGHDEETGGGNGAKKMAAHFKEKGIRFEYVLDEGALVIENALPGLLKPAALIGIAEKGYVSLELRSNAQAGHSSMPPKQTAIGVLSRALARLEKKPMPSKFEGPVREMFEYLGPEMTIPYKFIFANLWITKGLMKRQLDNTPGSNALLRTTTAITMVEGGVKDNVLPSTAMATVNFRIRPGDSVEKVIDFVHKTVNDDKIEITIAGNIKKEPSKVSGMNTFGYRTIQATISEIFEKPVVSPFVVIAGTDSRHYESVCDNIYRFLPVQLNQEDLEGIHGVNEKVSVENYKQCIRFFTRLIQNSSN